MQRPTSDSDSVAAILRARARALARAPESLQQSGEDAVEIVTFRLAHECYGFETSCVSEVHPLEDLTPLPGTPAFVLGLVNIRGRILPVLDLKKFFELPEQGISDLHRILLLRANDMEFGILADTIDDVRQVSRGAIQTSLPTFTGIRAQYLKGITRDRIIILDGRAIAQDPRILVNDEAET